MEYYIAVTDKCNLNCSFCFRNGLPKRTKNKIFSAKDIQKFINMRARLDNDKTTSIVFYGGEPLLNQILIEDIINILPRNEFIFSLYTNGLLLERIGQNILDNLSYLIVSLDGDIEKNDKYKGNGTFDIIVKNISEIKKKFNGETVARITLTSESSLYRSIFPIIDNFDHFFWQFESTKSCENSLRLHETYNRDLDVLLNYWIEKMQQGIICNFIPFQAIATSIIWNNKINTLRCGCGSSFIYIDSDGSCYTCDELVGYDEFYIGNIYEGIQFSGEYLYKDYIHFCSVCEVAGICGGRCIAAYIKYSADKFKYYCHNTKILINKMQKMTPIIKKIISEQGFSYDNIATFPASHMFEEIP